MISVPPLLAEAVLNTLHATVPVVLTTESETEFLKERPLLLLLVLMTEQQRQQQIEDNGRLKLQRRQRRRQFGVGNKLEQRRELLIEARTAEMSEPSSSRSSG